MWSLISILLVSSDPITTFSTVQCLVKKVQGSDFFEREREERIGFEGGSVVYDISSQFDRIYSVTTMPIGVRMFKSFKAQDPRML